MSGRVVSALRSQTQAEHDPAPPPFTLDERRKPHGKPHQPLRLRQRIKRAAEGLLVKINYRQSKKDSCAAAALAVVFRELRRLGPPKNTRDPLEARFHRHVALGGGEIGASTKDLVRTARDCGFDMRVMVDRQKATKSVAKDAANLAGLSGHPLEFQTPLRKGNDARDIKFVRQIALRGDQTPMDHALVVHPDGSIMDPALGKTFPDARSLNVHLRENGKQYDSTGLSFRVSLRKR